MRIPDGIVIAGDSLSTITAQSRIVNIQDIKCPDCGKKHKVKHTTNMAPTTISNMSYAEKVFSIFDRFGVGIFGYGSVGGKSVYFVIKTFEQKIISQGNIPINVTETADLIKNEFEDIAKKEIKNSNIPLDAISQNRILYGFQIVGYDDEIPKTIEINIGQQTKVRPSDQMGITLSGQTDVPKNILNMYKKQPDSEPPFYMFPIKDAVDYAEYLIQSTITHQRFSPIIPNVGGQIKIAQVTPFDGFQFVKQKLTGDNDL
jgi:hypothetical protein